MIRAQILGEAFAVAKYLTGVAKVREMLKDSEEIPEVQRILLALTLEMSENGLVMPVQQASNETESPIQDQESNEVSLEPSENSSGPETTPRHYQPEGMETSTKIKLIIWALIVGGFLYQLVRNWPH